MLGCEGEPVVEASDASTAPSDTGVSIDTTSNETLADASGCMLPGNLVPAGDFAMGSAGWAPYNTKTEPIEGPCGGRGLRLFDTTGYGSIGVTIKKPLPKGTKLRLRAYFRDLPGTVSPGAVSARLIHYVDGGEASTQEFGTIAASSTAWTPAEATVTLEQDELEIGIRITSRVPEKNELAVGAVSLVIEE